MKEQAVHVTVPCGNGHGGCPGWAVQLIRDNELGWDLEWTCDSCGIAHDEQRGQAPEWLRAMLIAEHGISRLTVKDARGLDGGILKVFRKVFGLSLRDAQKKAKDFLGNGYSGTGVEVSFLGELMMNSGREVSMEGSASEV
ncbi:hypothetical protein [Streptomyces cyaneofuscatus]|uniref:hypothetical protein n=1 Tax=Streptomyces cyaneofuscatus TaxID=66883 RepID=UPI00382D80C8